MRLGLLIACATLLLMGIACLVLGETYLAVLLIAIANTVGLLLVLFSHAFREGDRR